MTFHRTPDKRKKASLFYRQESASQLSFLIYEKTLFSSLHEGDDNAIIWKRVEISTPRSVHKTGPIDLSLIHI